MANTWNFNPHQLATWAQARLMAKRISSGPIIVGDGVAPETTSRETSGIYLPPWIAGPGGFPIPGWIDPATGQRYHYLHYRFNNGGEGMNVGLVIDKFRRYPLSPMYVLRDLAKEAETLPHG